MSSTHRGIAYTTYQLGIIILLKVVLIIVKRPISKRYQPITVKFVINK